MGDTSNAAVDARSIVWLESLTEQQKSDILNSTLLAQLSADAKSPVSDEENASEWHDKYVQTLSSLGWVVTKSASSDVEHSLVGESVADTILSALRADENADSDKELHESAARAVELLRPGSHPEAESVLNAASISSSAQYAGVQLAIAGNVNDSPSLTIFSYFYSSPDTITTALWHPIQDGATFSIKQFFVQIALNESVYERVREAVVGKLERVGDKIVSL
ncbi:unnamed protein product [Peniophora sp. CBMAI 1063]|nr:unnamed protein product [Peniophora sp. CBMAI 1063]